MATHGLERLPLEVREQIYDDVERLAAPTLTNPLHPYTNLTLVCREWYQHFRPGTFRVLFLDQDRLEAFDKRVTTDDRARACVRHIFFRIKLPTYDCPVYETEENYSTMKRNENIVRAALLRFFKILSTWPPRTNIEDSISLDLGIYSPSDGRHGTRDFRFSDGYHYGALESEYIWHQCSTYDPAHNDPYNMCPEWKYTYGTGSVSLATKKRISMAIGDYPGSELTPSLQIWNPQVFPPVPVITSFAIRRH